MKKSIGLYVLTTFLLSIAIFSFKNLETRADNFTPAIVFAMGGKFDKSFNQEAYDGAERFKKETGISYREFEVTNPAQREQAIRRMAQRKSDVIVGLGFAQANAIGKVAKEYPKLKFTIVDAVVDAPNVQSIIFKEHEGSFLVGVLAALTSKSNTISFVGGMDIPLIRAFACGYEQGAKYINPSIKVIQSMTGNDPTAWNNPSRGKEIARSQFEQGADIVYAAAGGTGVGVYQATKDSKKLAIGVDTGKFYLYPEVMLASMIKKVDNAVFDTMRTAKDGTWKGGVKVLGLKEGGIDWTVGKSNRALVSAKNEGIVEKAKQDIISGKIKVIDYRINNNCDS